MHKKELKKRYLHHTHAQPGTHGVGMLRCHIHTRKKLMSEILQKTRNNLSMTIYRHCICTENSWKKCICIIHMHNRALTVWARCGVTYIHEKYWCLKYCTRHSRTFLGPYIDTVYAQNRPDKYIFASYTCTPMHARWTHAAVSRTCTNNTDVWNTAQDTAERF